ncbi:MAG: hypothetical protein IAX21_08700 [Candidatus Bathyarchaeota archaeon]|nr:hypothetical protein [Candidatus Bathyarchaeum tardum]WGM89043.1 MAG: hypothetical protein NUK63_09020 [Candidatus Bathyarchaeum tardum]WNZ28719.1 MAG: hypothetical protein IAX21_08700 [Candidatus Bathyarchaeota archaeon]
MRKISRGGNFIVDAEKIVAKQRCTKTVHNQFVQHNEDIEKLGFCSICARLGENELITHSKKGKTV